MIVRSDHPWWMAVEVEDAPDELGLSGLDVKIATLRIKTWALPIMILRLAFRDQRIGWRNLPGLLAQIMTETLEFARNRPILERRIVITHAVR